MLRTSIEASDVIVGANDVLGRGVDLAARLLSLACPGEIVVSQHVRDGLTARCAPTASTHRPGAP